MEGCEGSQLTISSTSPAAQEWWPGNTDTQLTSHIVQDDELLYCVEVRPALLSHPLKSVKS